MLYLKAQCSVVRTQEPESLHEELPLNAARSLWRDPLSAYEAHSEQRETLKEPLLLNAARSQQSGPLSAQSSG